MRNDLGREIKKWDKALLVFNEKYEQAKGRATAHETQLTQLRQLEKRLSDLQGYP